MSKYKERGPYHFVDYCKEGSKYHHHVDDMMMKIYGFCRGQRVHEVGCGEGLILFKLFQWCDHNVGLTGNDADSEAVRMANLLFPGDLDIRLDTNITKSKNTHQVVIFSDSLEHIKNWKEHIEWAKSSNVVVIAIPSEFDRHAINEFNKDSFDSLFTGWTLAHKSTRFARHLMVWVKLE